MAGKLREISVWDDGTGTGERFFCMTAEPGGSFEEELHSLMDRYRESGGDGGDEFLLRFHVSDPARQSELLSRVVKGRRSYVSIVGQPPANGSRVALEAWHLGGMLGKSKEETEEGTVLVARRKHYRLFLAGRRTAAVCGSHDQMQEEFRWLDRVAAAQGGTVPALVHRTWIYCRDIDNNYRGLVEGRNESFDRYGLSPENHYIASTGIEGCTETPGRLLQTLRDSVKDITVITIILAFSGVFGYGIVFDNITVTIANTLLGITSNSAILLLLVVVFLLICGMFMETTVIALILTPILLPVMRSIGVNEVVFGMIMMTTVTFGVMTPPVGTALYAVSDIMECPIEETFKKGWPFYLAVVGVILFMIFFPQAVLFLPNLVYGA